MNERILVTGGNGYIGKFLVERLVEEGYSVGVFSKGASDIPNVDFFKGSILNLSDLNNAIKSFNPDVVFHLAGLTNGNSEELKSVNFVGTKNLFDSFSGKIIFPSTPLVYLGGKVPFAECDSLSANGAYAESKLLAEDYLKKRDNTLIFRIGVVYGPNQNNKMFISDLVTALKNKEKIVMTKGEQTRDFIYIKDLIDAFSLALKKDLVGVFNLSSGEEKPLKEVIEIVKKQGLGLEVESHLPYRDQELMRYALDTLKIKEALAWGPKYSLEEGIKELLQNEGLLK
jgi:UDP-glucose 4-epimerase